MQGSAEAERRLKGAVNFQAATIERIPLALPGLPFRSALPCNPSSYPNPSSYSYLGTRGHQGAWGLGEPCLYWCQAGSEFSSIKKSPELQGCPGILGGIPFTGPPNLRSCASLASLEVHTARQIASIDFLLDPLSRNLIQTEYMGTIPMGRVHLKVV